MLPIGTLQYPTFGNPCRAFFTEGCCEAFLPFLTIKTAVLLVHMLISGCRIHADHIIYIMNIIMVSRALFVVHKLWTYLLFGNSRKRWSKAQPIAEKKTERKHVQFPRKNVCFQDKVFQDIPRRYFPLSVQNKRPGFSWQIWPLLPLYPAKTRLAMPVYLGQLRTAPACSPFRA